VGRCSACRRGSLFAMRRWFWVLDLTVVVSFVVIGRDAHGFAGEWGATMEVALPFLLALSAGIGTAMVLMDPTSWLGGLVIAAVTVVGGLALRKYVFDDGTATTFVLLTAGWMVAWMVGWRLVAMLGNRLVDRRGASTTA
jgi:hypothetical protein